MPPISVSRQIASVRWNNGAFRPRSGWKKRNWNSRLRASGSWRWSKSAARFLPGSAAIRRSRSNCILPIGRQSPSVRRRLSSLKKTTIRAPISGVVSRMKLEPGEWVEEGEPVFTIVDQEHSWIEANLKETQLTHVEVGQRVVVGIDSYPDHAWTGKVASISAATGAEFALIPPQNASGNWVKVVQRLPVRIEIDPAENLPPSTCRHDRQHRDRHRARNQSRQAPESGGGERAGRRSLRRSDDGTGATTSGGSISYQMTFGSFALSLPKGLKRDPTSMFSIRRGHGRSNRIACALPDQLERFTSPELKASDRVTSQGFSQRQVPAAFWAS